MIIEYDRSPNASVDQKIQSLINSMQRALEESEKQIAELEIKLAEIERAR